MSTPATPSTPATRTPRIFVSHSHLDEAFALRVAGDFEAAGAYVWIDKHSIKDGNFLLRINQGLATCDWLVLVETTDSLTSEPVALEVYAAQNRVLYHQMRGVIRLIAGLRDPHIVPPTWATLQYYDATVDYAAAMRDTLGAIRDGDARWAIRSPAPTTPISRSRPSPGTEEGPGVGAASPAAAALLARSGAAYTANDWQAVADRTRLLLEDHPDAATVEVWRMRGRALLELSRPAEAVVALNNAFAADKSDLPTVRAYARAERALGDAAKAEPLLSRAMALADDDETRLDILGEYVPTLQTLDRWDDALSRIDEALRLRHNDPSWLRQRLIALTRLNRTGDALTLAQTLTARPDATVADWISLAQTIVAANPNPPNINADDAIRAQIARALEPAEALAKRATDPDPAFTQSIADVRHKLLSPISPDRFPARLASLGFTPRKLNNVEVITPPLCDIPAGPFLMGSDKRRDSQAYGDEQPQHTVTLAAYQIARYPVTVAEYACYARATGTQPGDWTTPLQRLDHPVVRVSWRDATAYAAWLAQTTGQPWRLPTEAEWEKAARGPYGRIYPWGDAWDRSRANTSEGGPGATTPVGAYPGGASPYGAQDMAGNVLEWTHTLNQSYPYTVTDGREDDNSTGNRVLRGGSWIVAPRLARAADRVVNDPGIVGGVVGFRVAVSALAHP